jgi:hypothetical protein
MWGMVGGAGEFNLIGFLIVDNTKRHRQNHLLNKTFSY